MKLPAESAHYLTQQRAMRGWGLRVAAERAGVSTGTWGSAERGGDVRYQSLVRIGAAIGLEPADVDRLALGHVPDDGPPPGGSAALDPDVVEIAALSGQLSPEARAKVEGYVRGLLAAEEAD